MEVMKDFNLREHIITGNIYVIYYRKWLTNKANLLIIFQFSSSLAITRVYTLAIWTQKMMIVYILFITTDCYLIVLKVIDLGVCLLLKEVNIAIKL